jgi:phosphatidylserine/phosphatidylglycerophosphate/cardiolipin synthase-like enzyme
MKMASSTYQSPPANKSNKSVWPNTALIFILMLLVLNIPALSLEASAKSKVSGDNICFSPDEPCDAKLIQFITDAKHSIDVAIFDINLDQFVHQLAVQSRKIKVRVVVDKRQSKGSHSLVSTLIKAGVDVRYGRQRGIMHDKFTIVDAKSLETGSFNYTNHASTSNQENQIYLHEPKVVKKYVERFEKIWLSGKPVPKEVAPPIEIRSPAAEASN